MTFEDCPKTGDIVLYTYDSAPEGVTYQSPSTYPAIVVYPCNAQTGALNLYVFASPPFDVSWVPFGEGVGTPGYGTWQWRDAENAWLRGNNHCTHPGLDRVARAVANPDHHPQCDVIRGSGFPCDCKTLRMLDAAEDAQVFHSTDCELQPHGHEHPCGRAGAR